MEVVFKPFCCQISCVKFIRKFPDNNTLFLVGSCMEPTNTLSLMNFGNGFNEPTLVSRTAHQGDVMDIEYNEKHDRILTASSNGSINIFGIESGDGLRLELDVGWDNVCGGAISGAIFGDERIIAVSEDGSIIGIRLDSKLTDPADIFEFLIRDSAAVNAVEQIDRNTFVTANGFGQIKLWDTRVNSRTPQWTNFRYGGEVSVIHSVCRHPGQPNVIASGGKSCVCLWDLRQSQSLSSSSSSSPAVVTGNSPVQLNTQLQGSDVWSVRFHPTMPQNLLAAASCCGLINISSSKVSVSNQNDQYRLGGFDWSDYPNALGSLGMTRLLGADSTNLTSLDIDDTGLLIVAGSDKEMLCVIPAAAVGL